MPIPKYYELYLPFLTAIQDQRIHALKDIRSVVAEKMCLSTDELTERLPSGTQCIFDNRLGWARAYLKKAGLIDAPQKAHFRITDEGKRLLESGAVITDALLADRYPQFAEFKGKKATKINEIPAENVIETPQEALDRAYQAINMRLADDLLTEIMNQTPSFFEQLIVDLMKAMGYGDGFVTKASGDGGIDGIIHEDRLGFNLIYIQAKRWNPDTTISKPEIHKFAGAMMGPPKVEKGLFITTGRFSQGAQEFAQAQHIILVDGKRLTELMIEYGLGVSTQSRYYIRRIDSDYFSDD